ncbi:MAG TPA: cytochrome c [Thermomicrobiaceae bacterium]|nr:cytochrome c [Thermomicrobiaceae bacterium]
MRRPVLVVALLALAGIVAGCGGVASVPTAAPTTGTGAAASASPTPAVAAGTPTTAPATTTVTTATAVAATPVAAASPTGVVITPSATPVGSVTAGERIFQTGAGPQGQPIPRSTAGFPGMMGSMMGSAGCAVCHGPTGQGLTTPAFTAPNISHANLTDPRGMLEPDGSRGPTYTDAGIARAVTTGIDAEGMPLDPTMPRWQMSDTEMADLLAYLKTLP